MPKWSTPALEPDSPVNSVRARLALYTTLAGVIGVGTAIAIKRRNMRDAAELSDKLYRDSAPAGSEPTD